MSVGRPRKIQPDAVVVENKEPKRFKMKAKPNWDHIDASDESTPDRLRIKPELIPEGYSFQWVTDSVYGQGVPQHRADFEKRGWTPVHQEDFDGQFDGMFMPKGAQGEIGVEGLVLMARPIEFTIKAERIDHKRAREQVMIKEQALRGGDIPITLDARHPSAVSTNRISKSYERLEIPGDK